MVGFLSILLASVLQVIPMGQAYVSQKSRADSVFVADRVEYGFELKGVQKGTRFEYPDLSKSLDPTIEIARDWQEKVLKTTKSNGGELSDIRCAVLLQPFDEKDYELPGLEVVRYNPDGSLDSLFFEPAHLYVGEIQIDTATFVVHDIKNQEVLETTLSDVLEESVPWLIGVAGVLALAAIIFFVVRFILKRRARAVAPPEPAHVVALRALEKYRSDKYWADDKQKAFYSGITDALRVYIASRFGIDAVEMTTSDIFDALKGEKAIPQELYLRTRELFELADFVKFAKHLASREENAAAIPTAVQFVTTAYQAELTAEATQTVKEEAE